MLVLRGVVAPLAAILMAATVTSATDVPHDKRLLFGLIPDSNVAVVSKIIVNNRLQAACTNILKAIGATKTVTATPTSTYTSSVTSTNIVGTDTTTLTLPATAMISTTATQLTGTTTVVDVTTTTALETTTLAAITQTAYITGAAQRKKRSHGQPFAEHPKENRVKAKRAAATPSPLLGFAASIIASGCQAVIGTPVPLTSIVFVPAKTSTTVFKTSTNVRATVTSTVTSTSTSTYISTILTGPAATSTVTRADVTTKTLTEQPLATAFCPPEANYMDGKCSCKAVDQVYVGQACVSCSSLGKLKTGNAGQCGTKCPSGTAVDSTGTHCACFDKSLVYFQGACRLCYFQNRLKSTDGVTCGSECPENSEADYYGKTCYCYDETTVFSESTKSCESCIAQGKLNTYDGVTCGDTCPSGTTVTQDGYACACEDRTLTFSYASESCASCSAQNQLNSNDGIYCGTTCPSDQEVSADGTACLCIDKTLTMVYGRCIQCSATSQPSGYKWDGTTCVPNIRYSTGIHIQSGTISRQQTIDGQDMIGCFNLCQSDTACAFWVVSPGGTVCTLWSSNNPMQWGTDQYGSWNAGIGPRGSWSN